MSVEPDFAAATRDCAGGMRVLTEVDPHHDHTVALGCQIRLLVLGEGAMGIGEVVHHKRQSHSAALREPFHHSTPVTL